jgi:hypothetical protein
MKTYGRKYKYGFIIEPWENPKTLGVVKKRERQEAKQFIKNEITKNGEVK